MGPTRLGIYLAFQSTVQSMTPVHRMPHFYDGVQVESPQKLNEILTLVESEAFHDGLRQSPILSCGGAVMTRGPESRERRDVIDFWRGFVLCTIFINHVPGNLFEHLTYRNFGLSDSAEAFVFISGLSLALAYGARFAAGQRKPVVMGLVRRTVKLYGVHIALSLMGLMIFALGASLLHRPELMQVHGRDVFVHDPLAGFIGLLSLGHQLGYFNILPVYVILVASFPAMLWLAHRSRALMLAVSLAIYGLVRVNDWNLPNWPVPGEWFFDPLAWQLLMAIGVAIGMRPESSVPRSRLLIALSCLVLLIACVCVTNGLGFVPGLWDWIRGWADLEKTELGAGRLVHFLALAYLISVLRVGSAMRHAFWFKPFCLIGRNGLWAFSVLSLLAAAEQVIFVAVGHSLLADTVMMATGLGILYGSVRLLALTKHRPASVQRSGSGLEDDAVRLLPQAAIAQR